MKSSKVPLSIATNKYGSFFTRKDIFIVKKGGGKYESFYIKLKSVGIIAVWNINSNLSEIAQLSRCVLFNYNWGYRVGFNPVIRA